MNKTHLYTVGGTIPPGKIYIQRQADKELLALCRAGSFAYVLSTRQVGKSSLMVQTARQLQREGTHCVVVDLTVIGTNFNDASWYFNLLERIRRSLRLKVDLKSWWQQEAHLSEALRLVTFFQDVVLSEVRTPIVIFLDEIDSTLSLPARADFFAAIRALYNARALLPALKRLTFVLIGVATPSDLIDDPKRTPFNIGQRVELTDFTLDEAAPLGEGFAEGSLKLLAWVLNWTGGHPYLTQRLCVALLREPEPVTEESEVLKVVAHTFFDEKAQQDHNLRFVRGMLTDDAPDKLKGLSTYRNIRLGGNVYDDSQSVIQNHLKLSGVVRLCGKQLRVRNPIYEKVFDAHWIKEQWPVNHEFNLYTVGGTIKAEGKLYIQRQADEQLLALCRAGTFAYVLAARQVGKSSLMVQTAHKLAAEGRHCVQVDLSTLGTQFDDADWYLDLLQMINDALGLMSDMRSWWEQQAHLSGTLRLVNFFKEIVVLSERPIVIFLDEIDSTFSLPVTADFFAAIRALYNARTQFPALKRLTFVLIGVAAPGDLINDPKRTPFNIGQRVELTDFTLDEALPLAEGLSLPAEQTQLVLTCLLKWTGGHPYLTQRLCVTLLQEPAQLSQFERDTREAEEAVERVVKRTFFGSKSEEDNHLQFVRDMLTKRAPDKIAVLSTYRNIREGRTVRHDAQSQIQSHLKLSGIVWREGNKLRVRNPIYEEVFDQKWIKEQWPLNWWQTVPRNVKIASVMMVIMFVALVLSLIFALNQQQQVKQQTKASEALFELSRNNPYQALLLTRASVFYDTTNYPIVVSRALQHTVEETKLLRQVLHHSAQVNSAEWSPDGQQVLTSSLDDKTRIWDATTGQLLLSLQNKRNGGAEESSASWSPDGQQVLTKSAEGEVQIWSRKGQLLRFLEDFSFDAMWSPDGQQVLTRNKHENRIQIWSQEGQLLQSFATDLSWREIELVTWSPDGTVVLAINSQGSLWIWEVTTGKLLQSIVEREEIFLVEPIWSSNGTVVLTRGKSVLIWKADTGLYTLTEASSYISSVAFRPDGQQLLIGSQDGSAEIWEVETGQLLTTLEEHPSSVNSVAWSPDGLRLLTGRSDGNVQAWFQEGQLLLSFTAHSSSVLEVAWHPDGQQLLTHDGSTVRIWDATTSQLLPWQC